MTDVFSTLWQTLNSGLPMLLLHFIATVLLLIAGVILYALVTPFHERRLIAQGNRSAGLVLAGAMVSLALPLGATLATSAWLLDILLWGLVAVIIQLMTFALFVLFFRGFREQIERDNMAAALVLVGIQLTIGLLNAGTMAG